MMVRAASLGRVGLRYIVALMLVLTAGEAFGQACYNPTWGLDGGTPQTLQSCDGPSLTDTGQCLINGYQGSEGYLIPPMTCTTPHGQFGSTDLYSTCTEAHSLPGSGSISLTLIAGCESAFWLQPAPLIMARTSHCPSCGDPIDPGTQTVFKTETDLAFTGISEPIAFVRYYVSA
jgi:hypothetical protein